LRAIEASRPDLVITDLLMPNMNGADLVQALRARPSTANLPVVALSASAASAAHRDVALDGFDAVLTKPVRFSELLECMGGCLGLTWVCGPRADQTEPPVPGTVSGELDERFIANLGDLAMRGDVQALKGLCDQAGRHSAPARRLLTELAPHVANYDTVAIRRVVASVTAGGSPAAAR
jgi:CheY-like chemotaxis protein